MYLSEQLRALVTKRANNRCEYCLVIIAKTKIGAATIKVLNLNDIDRIILRQSLIEDNRYP